MLNELKAQASLNYSINYTVNAEVISQGQLTTSIEPIYKCSNPIDLTLNTIQLYNVESTPVTVSFYVNGSLPVNQTVIFEIPALGSAIYKEDGTLDIMDSTGEVINRVGLTDAELRATPVPVTGTVTSTPSGTQDVNIVGDSVGLATETTLREVRDYVDNIETELISINTNTTGKSTEATLIQVRDYLDTVETKLSSLLTELQLKADLTETQPVSLASAPLPTGASTEATLVQVRDYLDTVETKLQSLITALGSPFQAGGSIGNVSFRVNAGTDVNTSALSLEATQQLLLTVLSAIETFTGDTSSDMSALLTRVPSGLTVTGSRLQVELPPGGSGLTDTELRATPVPVELGSSTNYIGKVKITDGSNDVPVGTSLADGQSNTRNHSHAESLNMLFNGTTWDRVRGDTSNGLDVDVTRVLPGTGATSLGKAEDDVHNGGDVGVMALAVSNEGGTAFTTSNRDYVPIAVDKMGQIYVNPENNKVLFRGRAGTFRTLGRAGTTGQKILAIHNSITSPVTVNVKNIVVDMWCTVVKAITVAPPIVRIWKFTAAPTNGTNLTKNKIGGTTTPNAACTVWGDASADGVGSATTLTITLPAGTIVDQKVTPRNITAAGESSPSSLQFNYEAGIQLAPLEGICVFLDYTLATQNPVTDMWTASIEWEEFTT